MPKAKKRRVNPRRRPATVADVKKAAKSGVAEAVSGTQTIFFSVLRDKVGWDNEQLRDFWQKVKDLSDEVVEGRISISDLRCVLREEAGIYI